VVVVAVVVVAGHVLAQRGVSAQCKTREIRGRGPKRSLRSCG